MACPSSVFLQHNFLQGFFIGKTQKKSHPKKAVLRSTQKEAPSVPPKSA